MKTSENIIEIAKAMNFAQKSMKPALKDATNPHFRSKYSDLASVMEAIREPVGQNGLSIWQDATLDDHGVNVTTRIVHVSGEWVEFGPLTIPLAKRDAHAVGSACSYGKRYALCAALGVVSDEDDDGNKASSPEKKSAKIVEMKENTITKEQAVEFNNLVEKCTSDFQSKIWGHLNSIGVSSYEKMNEDTFKKMRDACIGHLSKIAQAANAAS